MVLYYYYNLKKKKRINCFLLNQNVNLKFIYYYFFFLTSSDSFLQVQHLSVYNILYILYTIIQLILITINQYKFYNLIIQFQTSSMSSHDYDQSSSLRSYQPSLRELQNRLDRVQSDWDLMQKDRNNKPQIGRVVPTRRNDVKPMIPKPSN